MPDWVSGADGEKAWKKAKGIVAKEYGAGIEKSDPDKFYSLVTTVYKNVCKSPDYDCGIGKAEGVESKSTMRKLAEELAVFCEAISSSKLREANQMLGWHEADAKYLRKEALKEKGTQKDHSLKAADMHDAASDAFRVVLKSKSAKDLNRAKQVRKNALLFTRDR